MSNFPRSTSKDDGASGPASVAAGGVDGDTVQAWLTEQGHPLDRVEPTADHVDLEPLFGIVGDATIVGVGGAVGASHEIFSLTSRIVRFLVSELSFRAVALEDDPAVGEQLDDYLLNGNGDPEELLKGAWAPWQVQEVADLLTWLRSFNRDHPDDPVRLAGMDLLSASSDPAEAAAGEERTAEAVLAWQQQTGSRLVYLGGMAHVSKANPLTMTGVPTRPMLGSRLRDRVGSRYLAIGLTFDRGRTMDYSIPSPSTELVDSVLGRAPFETYLLDLRSEASPAVQAWLGSPVRLRLIGPRYDQNHELDYSISGGSLAEWLDVIVRTTELTPSRSLAG